MFQRFRFFTISCVIVCALALGLYAQEAGGPQSSADLDGEIRKTGALINQRLSSPGGGNQPRVMVGSFPFEGYDTSLGSYWTQNLISELSNLPGGNFSVIINSGSSPADYTISGEIGDLVNSVRIYTRLVGERDGSVIASWHTDLEKTEFLLEMLDTGDSPSGNSVSRDRYEPDGPENPLTVRPGDPWIDRTIHNSNDTDWFLIVPVSGGMLSVTTSGDMDTFMQLHDESGSLIEEDDDGGVDTNARVDYFVDAGARYTLLVRGYSDSTGRYRFQATLSEIDDSLMEPNDTMEQAFSLTPGEPADAFFHSTDDVDWYRVDIPAGGAQLLAYTEGQMDTLLTVFDGADNEIASDDDSGEDYNARISVFVPTGPAFIMVDRYEDNRGIYTINIQLREPAGPDEFEPDNTSLQAKEIRPGVSQRRTFSDEADWAFFNAAQEGYYIIQAGGETTTDLDTYLELFDEDEVLIDDDDDGGPDLSSRLRIRLNPGTYFIRVHALEDGLIEEHYILSVDRE
ncbi:MAG: hypothetical protein LBP32_07785 [Spirochaetaceae bacterium]|jgi:hypothetical protein|nr:hypothetical protein [Spirochaetaceae bacterium]